MPGEEAIIGALAQKASQVPQTLLGLGEAITGLVNSSKTKKEAARLAASRPQYEISPLVGEGLSLTKSDLANGMSAGAEQAFNNLNNQQFSASLGGILRGGGDVNSIGAIYGNSQDGALRLAQMKDNLRLNQINNLVRASQRMSDEQQTQWQVDKLAPWQDAAQANANARMGAQKQTWEGLSTLGASLASGAQKAGESAQYSLPTYGNTNPATASNTNAWQGTPLNKFP